MESIAKDDERYVAFNNPRTSIINRHYITYLDIEHLQINMPELEDIEENKEQIEENEKIYEQLQQEKKILVKANITGKFDEIKDEYLAIILFGEDDKRTFIEPFVKKTEEGLYLEFETSDEYFAIVEARRDITLEYYAEEYKVTVNFNAFSGIPQNALLKVAEITQDNTSYDSYVKRSSAVLGEEILFARAFDISLLNPQTGEEYQPGKGVKVKIDMYDDSPEEMNVDVVHIHEEGRQSIDVLNTTKENSEVEFETPGFSIFVVVGTTLEKVIQASDGNSYLVSLSYNEKANLPENIALKVEEIKEDNLLYEDYMKQSSRALGKSRKNFVFAKIFDISIVSLDTGEIIEPNENVHVSIELLDQD